MAILGIRIGSLLLEAYACAAEKGHAYGLLHPFTWFTTPVYMVYYTRLHGLLHPFTWFTTPVYMVYCTRLYCL